MKIKEKLENEASLKNKLQQEIEGLKTWIDRNKNSGLPYGGIQETLELQEAKLQAIQDYEKEILEMIEKIKKLKVKAREVPIKMIGLEVIDIMHIESLEKEIRGGSNEN